MSESESNAEFASEPLISNREIVVLESTQDSSHWSEFFVRLVPLRKGGIAANSDWVNPSEAVLKPEFERGGREIAKLTSSWTWPSDQMVRIDDTHTPVQVVQHLIDTLDELMHLRPLTADQWLNFVTLEPFELDDALLGKFKRHEPIDLKRKRYGYFSQTIWWGEVKFPTLFVLAFPLTVDERLLQPVPRDDTKPLLWLDVDGVVNGSMGSDKQEGIACFGEESSFVHFSPQIVRELNRLSKVCDVYWSTVWGKWARFRLAPAIGLDDFNVWPGGKGSMDAVVNFDRPLIWIDDYLDEKSWNRFNKEMVDAVKATFKHHLLIGPRLDESSAREHGLTMRHIEQIDAFLAEHSAQPRQAERADNPTVKRRRVKDDDDDDG